MRAVTPQPRRRAVCGLRQCLPNNPIHAISLMRPLGRQLRMGEAVRVHGCSGPDSVHSGHCGVVSGPPRDGHVIEVTMMDGTTITVSPRHLVVDDTSEIAHELQQVQCDQCGRSDATLQACGRCHSARYCSRDCQVREAAPSSPYTHTSAKKTRKHD